MSEIIKYGVAFPEFNISGKVLDPQKGKNNGYSICYVDEDLITLSYRACSQMLTENDAPDAILFATATPVFKGRYHASYLANLLRLPAGIFALDIISTVRAGTDALLLADKLIQSGQYKNILLVAAHVEFPGLGEEIKALSGHAAVALLISSQKGMATITSVQSFSSSLAEEFYYKGEKTEYDSRFARSTGFMTNLKQAWKITAPDPQKINGLIMNSPYARIAVGLVKKAGFDTETQLIKDNLLPVTGHTGACHALLLMLDAIENTSGVQLLFDYTNGSNVIAFDIYENPSNTRLSTLQFTQVESFTDYLKLKKQGDFTDVSYQSKEMFSSEMMDEREKGELLYLTGHECKACHSVYLLKATRCPQCRGDDFTGRKLSHTGTVYTLTAEFYFPSSFPPIQMVVIDLDGGGRMTVQQTDVMYINEQTQLKIGDRVELVLRSMMENDRKPNYFWKCKKINE